MEKLSHQPLLEVAFELNWRNTKYPFLDPNYQILIGALYERVREKFPQFEVLATASIPPEALPLNNNKLVQYRFWSSEKTWPVIQVGPGIITVNIDKSYEGWDKFRQTIIYVVNVFINTYPDSQDLFVDKLTLRYLNGFYFDNCSNILEFLSKYLHINLGVSFETLGEQGNLIPSDINLALTYELQEPDNFLLNFKTFKGRVNNEEKLLLEILIASNKNESIKNFNIDGWLEKAHEIVSSVFNSLIRGKLKEKLR